MGFFSDIESASASGGGNRFKPGRYTIKVGACSVNQGFHGTRFVLEGEVLESDGEDASPVGSTGSWTARIDGQYGEIGLGEVKGVYLAALGLALDAQVTEGAMMAAVGPEQTLAGAVLKTEAWSHTTKSGNAMIKHRWESSAGTPAAPSAPAAPAAPAAFPPEGWTAHPDAPGHYYLGQEVLTEAQLRAR